MNTRMFRALGCAVYYGHPVHLSPAQHEKSIASFRVWGFSVWRVGVLVYSKWIGR